MPRHAGVRPVTPEDLPFLYAVYASTRMEELAVVPWSEAEKEAFLRMQFQAQHRHYREHYPEASFLVVELDGQPVGRLYVHRGAGEIRVIDIALLPAYRNRGIGSAYLRELMEEARATNKSVTIHVERNNPALRLYERLGFRKVEDKGVYFFLAWAPTSDV